MSCFHDGGWGHLFSLKTLNILFSGWLYKVKLSDMKELENLMDKDGYDEFLKEQD